MTNALIPLPVILPLLVGALLVGVAPVCHRRLADAVGVATAALCTIACGWLAWRARDATLVSWFGGWRPRGGVALGIAFAIDPLGAGAAALASGLMTAALVFAWNYFDAVRTYFHALMMIFLAGMTGFALTGDLFNQFVFFELMSVTAYALTGYKVEDPNALEGAINFAVTNTIGAFLVLVGIALLYGRTGALNLAQVGEGLRRGGGGALPEVALTLIACGFFVKAAIVPFHFWLVDAHAVAPSPVCVLFSGIMIELGLFGAFRVYATVFRGLPGLDETRLRATLAMLGAVTAILGAVMCFAQRHFKRLLAYSSVSHVGMILLGASLLTGRAVAGAALYVAGHGLVKGALFLCAGLVLHRWGTVDQLELRGRGRTAPILGLVWVVAAVGLAGFPPFGTYVGKQLMEEAAKQAGADWIPLVFFFASAVTSAAVLRFAGVVFLGWGVDEAEESRTPTAKEEPETRDRQNKAPVVMLSTAAVLAALPSLIGLLGTRVGEVAERAAGRFLDTAGYAATVLQGRPTVVAAAAPLSISATAVATSVATMATAVVLALAALFRHRWPAGFRRGSSRLFARPMSVLLRLHSGNVADYVTWVVVGVVVFSLWRL